MDDNERNHIKTFDCHGDRNTLGLRWKRWLIAFELFADGKGLILNEENANNRQRRRALLLHLAGTDVQDIFYILPDTGDAKDYKKAVDALNAPRSASETRSFLGLVNYRGRLIPDLATISEPLRRLTKTGTPFVFGKEQKEAFVELKKRLSNSETLGYFDKDALTQAIADASPVGLGAVLTQMSKDGPRIISYASRSLTGTETRYSQTEKEALALIWACEKFHPYIYGVPFELITDHKPLEVIYGPRYKPYARSERWVLRMQPYKFKVKYQPGPKNIADPLSRLLSSMENGSKRSSQAEEYICTICGSISKTQCNDDS